jgi:aminopeptidase N
MTRRARNGPTAAGGEHVCVLDYMAAMRAADAKFEAERDRRYTEVSIEREKALKIKEVADLAALQLAREIQTYKDEKANELREQISSERGNYATREDLSSAMREISAMIRPLAEYVSSQQGRSTGLNAGWGYLLGAASLIGLIITLIVR